MIKAMPRFFTKLIIFLVLSVCLPPCFSASNTVSGIPETELSANLQYKDSWHLHLHPYLWFAGLSGQVNIRGKRVRFDDTFNTLRQNLDFSLGAHFEADKGPWSLLLDPDYVKITQHPYYRDLRTKTTYETTITDAGAYYKLYTWRHPQEKEIQASFELLGAGRIATFHTVIDFLRTEPVPASDTSSIVVPIIGARLKYNFNAKVHTWLSGDFGGFQVSHVSSTWSTMLGLRYQFTPFFDLSLAYKVWAVNYSIQAITINTLLQGPILSCGFSW